MTNDFTNGTDQMFITIAIACAIFGVIFGMGFMALLLWVL